MSALRKIYNTRSVESKLEQRLTSTSKTLVERSLS